MIKLKITKASGDIVDYDVTPAIEYAFELHAKMGFHKALIEQQKQSDVYWLCWEAIRRSGETVKPFGEAFLETIKGVEVLESDPLD